MFTKSSTTTLTALAVAATLTACGGGGGGSDAGTTPTSPTSVSSTGVITGFGSVFVSGTRYETTGAEIEFEDDTGPKTEDDLELGMKVRVRARQEDDGRRVAERIRFDRDLKGPVRDVDANADGTGTFTVVGQTVRVDDNTLFDDDVGDVDDDGTIGINDLIDPPGAVVVEVSGFPADDGSLVATRIDRLNPRGGSSDDDDDNEVEVKGFVDEGSVNLQDSSFSVNGTTFLVVDGTSFDDGLLFNAELEGVFVEVKANETSPGEFEAVEVEREDDFGDNNNDGLVDDDDRFGEFEIEGVLQSVDTAANPNTFTINGITVPVTDASSLLPLEGQRVEIKGGFNADGVLVLRPGRDGAKAEVENSIRVEDGLASVDINAGTLTTTLGVTITPTGRSRVEIDDDLLSGADGDRLRLEDFINQAAGISPGFEVEARGFPNGDGTVTWTRVKIDDDPADECRLRGPVESEDASASTLVIQGVTIDASGAQFRNAAGSFLSSSQFFDQLEVNDVVQAKSDDDNPSGCVFETLTAEEVEFEEDDGVFGTVPPGQGGGNAGDDNGGDDNGNDDVVGGDDVSGTASTVSATGFNLNGTVVTVTADTLIDASLVEAARGDPNLGPADLRLGDIPEALVDLIQEGDSLTVRIDASGNALLIEDNN